MRMAFDAVSTSNKMRVHLQLYRCWLRLNLNQICWDPPASVFVGPYMTQYIMVSTGKNNVFEIFWVTLRASQCTKLIQIKWSFHHLTIFTISYTPNQALVDSIWTLDITFAGHVFNRWAQLSPAEPSCPLGHPSSQVPGHRSENWTRKMCQISGLWGLQISKAFMIPARFGVRLLKPWWSILASAITALPRRVAFYHIITQALDWAHPAITVLRILIHIHVFDKYQN